LASAGRHSSEALLMDDPVLLSRIQFALTIMFHYLFPPLTIGMGLVLVYLEGMFLRTRKPIYETAARFWTQIFALNFAIGVASGIVMEFQFGTNWATYSRYVGDVFGSALAAEGIFAFFLESGFLAVLVFGWDRVSPRMHFFSTIMVALGSIFSSVWIVVANSWQQTPAGFHVVEHVVNGQTFLRAEVTDFWAVVFNPSTIHRLVHVWIGAFIVGSFFIMSISAWYILKKRHLDFARRSFSGALIFATISSLAALVHGHFQARNVYEHQPAKLAAFEGHYETGEGGAPLHLFGWPDDEAKEVKYGLSIPGGLSFLLFDNFDTPVTGLNDLEEKYGKPPVWLTFQSYHLMVALGMAFIALTLLATFLHWRGKLYDKRWLMWVFVVAIIGPFAANQLGWVAAEVGRQPWTVYPAEVNGEWVAGLTTTEGLSETLEDSADKVLFSIGMFGLIYGLLFFIWLYVLNDKIQKGPKPVAIAGADPPTDEQGFIESAAQRAGHTDSLTATREDRHDA
jgi:cytochrome d ubiquinol oxidase subunit I